MGISTHCYIRRSTFRKVGNKCSHSTKVKMQNEDVPTVTHDGLERMPADSEVNLGIETPKVDTE